MHNQISMSLYFPTPLLIVMNFVAIEGQGREPKERDRCLQKIANVLAIWQLDFCWFWGRNLIGIDFGTKDPIPVPDLSLVKIDRP